MFFVDLEPQVNNKEIYKLEFLQNTKIRVEAPRIKNSIIQCTRCQDYGHSQDLLQETLPTASNADNLTTVKHVPSLKTPLPPAPSAVEVIRRVIKDVRFTVTSRPEDTPNKSTSEQPTQLPSARLHLHHNSQELNLIIQPTHKLLHLTWRSTTRQWTNFPPF